MCSSIGGYGLVFGSSLVFGVDISYVGTLSENMYLDDGELSKTVLVYRSNTNISDYSVYSSCASETNFLKRHKGIYFFEVDFSQSQNCKNENIILQNPKTQEKIVNSMSKLEFIHHNQTLATFIDYSDTELAMYAGGLENDIKRNTDFQIYAGDDIIEYYNSLSKKRQYLEAAYKKSIVDEILYFRQQKYLVPVAGNSIATGYSKIPNAPRNYRASYTDGIHHGWDIDGEL